MSDVSLDQFATTNNDYEHDGLTSQFRKATARRGREVTRKFIPEDGIETGTERSAYIAFALWSVDDEYHSSFPTLYRVFEGRETSQLKRAYYSKLFPVSLVCREQVV